MFLSLPTWVQDKIKGGLEFKGSKLDNLLQNHKGTEKKEASLTPELDDKPDAKEEGENW